MVVLEEGHKVEGPAQLEKFERRMVFSACKERVWSPLESKDILISL